MGRAPQQQRRHEGESEATAKEKADQEQVFVYGLNLNGGRCPHHVGKWTEFSKICSLLTLSSLNLLVSFHPDDSIMRIASQNP